MTPEKENIRGNDALNLIEQVRRDRTLVNMRMPETDMELLTVIDGIQTSKNGRVFAVDVPVDLKRALDSIVYGSLKFEFMDSKKVPCEFTASTAEISADRIWVTFPDVIYREQKREDFRVEVPLRTRLCFRKDTDPYRMNVSNISMGGILITLRADARDAHILSVGEELRDIQLVFPSESVQIREAVVARMEEGVPARSVHFGIQFVGINEDERRVLKEILYKLQREFLARRAGTA